MLINNIKITLWLKLEKASLEQKSGKNVSYSIVYLKSSNTTSIKSNVTWIKTMRCINHFLLFPRRQNGRAYIKIRRKNLKTHAGNGGGGGGGLPLPVFQNKWHVIFLSFYTSSYIFISWVRYSPPLAASHLLIYILMGRRPSYLVSKIKAKGKFTYILRIPRCIETRQSYVSYIFWTWIKEVKPKAWSLKVIGQTKDYAVQVSLGVP